MLYLHQTNNLNILFDDFYKLIIDNPPQNPMKREQVIVQTRGMETWLTLETTRRKGVFCNIKFSNPTKFLTTLEFHLTDKHEEKSVYEKSVLQWAIFRLLTENIEDSSFKMIKNYLENTSTAINSSKLFGLSIKIADIFDQYMIYRTDMLKKWEEGKRVFTENPTPYEDWQMVLWNKIKLAFPNHKSRAAIIEAPEESIKNKDKSKKLQNYVHRLSLFGMSVLPPYYFHVLTKLSEKIDIHFFLLNPSPLTYWGHTSSNKQFATIQKNLALMNKEDTTLQDSTHPFLSNFGKLGADFFDLVYEANLSEVKPDIKGKTSNSMLSCLQSDILQGEKPESQTMVQADDHSIRIEICHSARREVEVLYDMLSDAFEKDTELSPADILIVTPDLEGYAPYIDLIFGSGNDQEPHIPYSISDRSFMDLNSTANTLKNILDTITDRFQATQIISLFEEISLEGSVEILPEHIKWIHSWIKESGVRWGLDEDFRKKLGLPKTDAYSWKKGVRRMILGYAMEQDTEASLYQGMLPLDNVEGDLAAIMGVFIDFYEALNRFYQISLQTHVMNEWVSSLENFLSKLYNINISEGTEDQNQNEDLLNLFKKLNALTEDSEIADYKSPISFQLFKTAVVNQLENNHPSASFLKGKVTFASMVPMRSIPFKIIAIIGMNHGIFPRRNEQNEFDLMNKEPQTGDRNILMSDRYLFLELLLSTSKELIITYTGRDQMDNSPKPPSTVVPFLLEVLDRSFEMPSGTPVSKHIQTVHPLHPFSSRYNTNGLLTYQKHWFETISPKPQSNPFEWKKITPEFDSSVLDGNLIEKCLKKPLLAFLHSSVHTVFPEPKQDLPDSEPFKTDHLLQWFIKEAKLTSELTNHKSIFEAKIRSLDAEGKLPIGIAREQWIAKAEQDVNAIFKKFNDKFPDTALDSQNFNFEETRKNILFRYHHPNLLFTQDASAILLSPSKMNGKQRISVWILHLFLNLTQNIRTILFTPDDQMSLSSLDSQIAENELLKLHETTPEILSCPFPFHSEASWKYLNPGKRSKKDPFESAMDILFPSQDFEKGQKQPFEHTFFYSNKFLILTTKFRTDFIEQAKLILTPLIEHLENK